MTTTDEKSAGMPTTGRFGKLRTLAGRVLRRGPVGPEPVQRRAPLPMAPTGECTARWCMAHDHGPRPGLAASGAKPVLAIAQEVAPAVLAQHAAPSPHATGTAMEMPLGQGVRALLAKMETTPAELDAPIADPSVPPEDGAAPTNAPVAAGAEDVEAASDDGIDADTTPDGAIVAGALDTETVPDGAVVAGAPAAETVPGDDAVASVRDRETTSTVASGDDDGAPDEPAPTRDSAATDDRPRDSRDRPALIPEVLPPAAPNA